MCSYCKENLLSEPSGHGRIHHWGLSPPSKEQITVNKENNETGKCRDEDTRWSQQSPEE